VTPDELFRIVGNVSTEELATILHNEPAILAVMLADAESTEAIRDYEFRMSVIKSELARRGVFD
jgi:hypothetical protein